MKWISIANCALIICFTATFAQNVMQLPNVSGNAEDTVVVSVNIENADEFVGFQCDIPFPDVVSFVDGSAMLTARENGHDLVTSLIGSDTLRIISYSLSQSPFLGDSGSVVDFQITLGTDPGIYLMELVDPIIANALSQNILTTSENGQLTLWASDIYVDPSSLDFGEVPLTQFQDRSFSIYNNGNLSLNISRIYTDHSDFSILGDTSYVIIPGGNQNVSIRFTANTKGHFDQIAFIESDDPDESTVQIPLSVYAFAVNEMDVNDTFGRSGFPATLSLDIANMEPFVGFQFDLLLPSVMSFVDSSESLTSRATDHEVMASMSEPNILTVVAYSLTNDAFTGIEGDVLELSFNLDGQGGFYQIELQNPIIADSIGENIISDFFGGQLEIISPDIWANPTNIDFGVISIFDTNTVFLEIGNNGSDTLVFSDFIFSDSVFFADFSGVDILAVDSSISIPINFHANIESSFVGSLTIRSNDPDEDPYVVDLYGESFIPNSMSLNDIDVLLGGFATGNISVENFEPFVAFQCNVNFPIEVLYLEGSAQLTARAVDHQLVATMITDSTLQIISYSLTQSEFIGDSGAVVTFDVQAIGDTGTYDYTISEAILSNAQLENILAETSNGQITILPVLSINNLIISIINQDIELEWTAPLGTMGYYRIYRDSDPYFSISTAQDTIYFNGSTSGTVIWSDENIINSDDKLFYIVTHATTPGP